MAAGLWACSVLCLLLPLAEGETFDEPYANGVAAYRESRWLDSVDSMQNSNGLFTKYKETLEMCSKECSDKRRQVPSASYGPDPEVNWFHVLIDKSWCFKKCFKVNGITLGGVNDVIYSDFMKGEVYNYLQICYYKTNYKKEAALIAAKYAGINPLSEQALNNINFYKEEKLSVPIQHPSYQLLYTAALDAYNSEAFRDVVKNMEKSLIEFIEKFKECRMKCDGPVMHEQSLEFSTAAAQHFRSMLSCRVGCVDELGKFKRATSDNFFASYFRYLVFCYYKLEKYGEAIQALVTQREISGETDEIVGNWNAFKSLEKGFKPTDWNGREDVKEMVHLYQKETSLLALLDKVAGSSSSVVEVHDASSPDAALLDQDYVNHPVGVPEATQLTLVESEEDHGGLERVVYDGLLNEQQCRTLMQLARLGVEGDGYGQKSPHTKFEMFEGITALSAAKAASSGEATKNWVKLYLDASEMSRALVEKHFKLKTHLYYSYTHLVCRTAKDGSPVVRDDLSHPVHSDNCILNPKTGECDKIPPAYTWRDYSAILYLNEDIEGGKFFFAHNTNDLSPESYVSAKCGRIVGFSAGKENMHGVTAVTKGRRCAVALWFTLDESHQESSIVEAYKILDQL